jgi:exosortase A-associated hydrolase 2
VLEAFFLPLELGQRLCILNSSTGSPRRAVVYVHPFAEEMNKTRRMAALQARHLAAEGFVVLQMDLYGCGDSGGDFSQARWHIWRRDVQAAVDWLWNRFQVSVTLWGLRLGATLAAQIAASPVDHLVLWHPVTEGQQFILQFLRLRLASEMLAGGAATTAVRDLSAALANGNSLEIAGYELHPELAAAIENIRLEGFQPAVKRVDWIDIVGDSELALRPGARRVVDAWRSRNLEVHARQVAGEPFWSTIEISECEPLLVSTTEAMRAAP